MVRLVSVLSVLCCVPFAGQAIHAQTGDRLSIHHADDIEYIFSKLQDTTLVTGAVIFETKSGMIYCDSAVWLPGKDVTLRGRVIIDDKDYRLAADDSVRYNLFTIQADAYG